MKKSRYTESQIIGVLKEVDAGSGHSNIVFLFFVYRTTSICEILRDSLFDLGFVTRRQANRYGI
ncbi:hypothetical protein ALT761_02560 [Alteromonas sp. 76-1]|jgi:hypothetical protein|nr:hypothetical protein ALT761_02560 [Alteromonas sp. 76-1]